MLLFLICIIIMKILVLWCYIYIYLLLTNSFGLLNSQKIAKKESLRQVRFYLITYFGMNVRIHFFTSMYVLNFVF